MNAYKRCAERFLKLFRPRTYFVWWGHSAVELTPIEPGQSIVVDGKSCVVKNFWALLLSALLHSLAYGQFKVEAVPTKQFSVSVSAQKVFDLQAAVPKLDPYKVTLERIRLGERLYVYDIPGEPRGKYECWLEAGEPVYRRVTEPKKEAAKSKLPFQEKSLQQDSTDGTQDTTVQRQVVISGNLQFPVTTAGGISILVPTVTRGSIRNC